MKRKKVASRASYLKTALFFTGFVVFIGFSVYLLFFSSVFQVNNLKLTGSALNNIEGFEDELKNKIKGQGLFFSLLGSENMFFWELTGRAEETILKENPNIGVLEITRDFTGMNISVSVSERERFGIACGSDNNCFWIDENGFIFLSAPYTEGGLINKVYFSRELKIGETILNPELMVNLIRIFGVLEKAGVRTKAFLIDESLLEARTAFGIRPEMLFSLKIGQDFVFTAINELMQRGWKKFSMLDFRVENRVYYK